MLHNSSQNYIVLHRSPFVLLFEFLQLFIPFSMVILIAYFSHNPDEPRIWTDTVFLNRVYHFGGGILLLEIIRRYFNDLYVFGNRRLIRLSGRLSFRRKRISIGYEDIKEIRVKQSLWARIFRYGTLQFGTSATDKREIHFSDIPFPEDLSCAVEQLINKKQKGLCPSKLHYLGE